MAFRSKKPNGVSLTASAEKIPDNKDSRLKAIQEWQKRAWEHYDDVPEINFATNYIANALRRIRMFPATWDDAQAAPVALDKNSELGTRSYAELDRLRGTDGTHGTILHDAALQFSIPGEAYLIAYDDPDDGTEVWAIFSTAEIDKRDGKYYLKDTGDNGYSTTEGVELKNAVGQRIWHPHPRFRNRPDSPMKSIRNLLDELMLMDRMYRSTAKSRMSAGIWLVPSEVVLPTRQRVGMDTGDGQGRVQDGFVDAVLTALTTPIADEDSASNVAPAVIKVPGAQIQNFQHVAFPRDYDKVVNVRYDKVLQRIATGLDLPSSIITGNESLNHWSAWQVSEDSFDEHLAPLVQLIVTALTEAFLRPALLAAGVGEDVIIWYDASALLSHPNKASDADAAYDRMLISDAAYRRYKGYSEQDVPSDEEVQKRLDQAAVMKPSTEVPTTKNGKISAQDAPITPPNDGVAPEGA